MSSTKSSADCAAMSIRGREGRGPRRSQTWLPPRPVRGARTRSPSPSRRPLRLDDLPDCQVSTVQVRHPAAGPFGSVASSTSLLALLGGFTLHHCSRLSHCPPFLTHSIFKTSSHQDSANEGPFALAHPVQIQGYTEFPAHALISWL